MKYIVQKFGLKKNNKKRKNCIGFAGSFSPNPSSRSPNPNTAKIIVGAAFKSFLQAADKFIKNPWGGIYGGAVAGHLVPIAHKRVFSGLAQASQKILKEQDLLGAVNSCVEILLKGDVENPSNIGQTRLNLVKVAWSKLSKKDKEDCLKILEKGLSELDRKKFEIFLDSKSSQDGSIRSVALPLEDEILSSLPPGLRGGGSNFVWFNFNKVFHYLFYNFGLYLFLYFYFQSFFLILDNEMQKDPLFAESLSLFYHEFVIPFSYKVNKEDYLKNILNINDECYQFLNKIDFF